MPLKTFLRFNELLQRYMTTSGTETFWQGLGLSGSAIRSVRFIIHVAKPLNAEVALSVKQLFISSPVEQKATLQL